MELTINDTENLLGDIRDANSLLYLGTILPKTSTEFQWIFQEADVVIAKGQANYESLSDERKDIYFLLMTKCKVIAENIGVKEKALVCLKSRGL